MSNSTKVENNEDNREKLAEEVVDSWDMDCLLEYARTSLVVQYRDEDEDFQRDWKTMEMEMDSTELEDQKQQILKFSPPEEIEDE